MYDALSQVQAFISLDEKGPRDAERTGLLHRPRHAFLHSLDDCRADMRHTAPLSPPPLLSLHMLGR